MSNSLVKPWHVCRYAAAAVALLASALLMGPAPATAETPEGGICVAPSDLELPLAVDLPEGITIEPGTAWQLVEEGTGTVVPAQLGAVPAADGTVAAEQGRVLAIIPPGGEGDKPRHFRLFPAEDATAPVAFEFEEITPASIKLREGRQPVMVYNHGVITRADLPEQEHLRSRACYIHPLYGLSGEVLTDDFPDDHYHHHGAFWTWPHVVIGESRHDLWAGATIRQVFQRWLVREAGPVAAVLAVENGWLVDDDEQVMVERVWMRAFRGGDDDRAVDLELFFTPLAPVTLQGAAEKSYGGLTVRFAPGPREETLITVPDGPTTGDLPDTPLAWADFTSRFGDMEHRSGAAIFIPPHHPDFPPTWLTRYYGPLCIGWPGVEARTFEAGSPFALDYRLWIHREAADFEELTEAYEAFTRASRANWPSPASMPADPYKRPNR